MSEINWNRVWTAGLLGGIIFLIVEFGLLAAFGEDPMIVIRMIAAIAMGRDVLPIDGGSAAFNPGITVIALVIHLGLSIALTVLFAAFLARWTDSVLTAVLVGGLFGLGVYFFNLYVMTSAFPWFMDGRSWMNGLAHLIFGVVIAVWLRPRDERFAI